VVQETVGNHSSCNQTHVDNVASCHVSYCRRRRRCCLVFRCRERKCAENYYYFRYYASAAVAVDSSHTTASSSASWTRFSPPSNYVNGHKSTMSHFWSIFLPPSAFEAVGLFVPLWVSVFILNILRFWIHIYYSRTYAVCFFLYLYLYCCFFCVATVFFRWIMICTKWTKWQFRLRRKLEWKYLSDDRVVLA